MIFEQKNGVTTVPVYLGAAVEINQTDAGKAYLIRQAGMTGVDSTINRVIYFRNVPNMGIFVGCSTAASFIIEIFRDDSALITHGGDNQMIIDLVRPWLEDVVRKLHLQDFMWNEYRKQDDQEPESDEHLHPKFQALLEYVFGDEGAKELFAECGGRVELPKVTLRQNEVENVVYCIRNLIAAVPLNDRPNGMAVLNAYRMISFLESIQPE